MYEYRQMDFRGVTDTGSEHTSQLHFIRQLYSPRRVPVHQANTVPSALPCPSLCSSKRVLHLSFSVHQVVTYFRSYHMKM
jgi:hypothetical protein